MTAMNQCRPCAATEVPLYGDRCADCIRDDHRAMSAKATPGPFYVEQDNDWTFSVRDYRNNALIARFTQRYHGPRCVISADEAKANAHRFAANL